MWNMAFCPSRILCSYTNIKRKLDSNNMEKNSRGSHQKINEENERPIYVEKDLQWDSTIVKRVVTKWNSHYGSVYLRKEERKKVFPTTCLL